jgi:hypothetical protein
MKGIYGILLVGTLMTSPPSVAFAPNDPIVVNTFGLGTSPLGSEIKSMGGNWNNENSPTRIKYFLGTFVGRHPTPTNVKKALVDAGLECDEPQAKLCTYTGIYMYELRQSDGPVKRTGWRLDIAVNFEKEPWDVKAYGRYIYGPPSPGAETERFKFP